MARYKAAAPSTRHELLFLQLWSAAPIGTMTGSQTRYKAAAVSPQSQPTPLFLQWCRSRFPAFGFLGSGKHGEGNTFFTTRLDALRRRRSCLDEHSWCFGGEIFSVPNHLYSFIIFVVPMICGDPVVSGKNTCQHCPYYKSI